MANDLIVEFVDNSLKVKLQDGKAIIDQPFAPDGNQTPWANEAEALAWWDTIKDSAFVEDILSNHSSDTSGDI